MAEQQLIDSTGAFTGSLESCTSTSSTYGVVSVIGCQSGGKSTLLNAAFGTSFPVLDAPASGRRRTTLGVWGAVASPSHLSTTGSEPAGSASSPLVVLDVEGSDSRERGENARAFESRTALLSLALSDVVVVNMWSHDVGRHSAANYDLFETVFAHAARMRSTGSLSKRVNVLVAVRDHDEHAPIDAIEKVLMGDLEAIWGRLRVRGVAFEDLFCFEFAALPHRKYAPDAFKDAVEGFADRVRETAVAEKEVPLAAFEPLARAVWESVVSATGASGQECALDLPKHAALVAHFEVGRLVHAVLSGSVSSSADGLREEIESDWRTPIPLFDVRVGQLVGDAFEKFDESAAPFSSSTSGREAVEVRRAELATEIVSKVGDLRERYLWVCRESTLAAFEDEFRPVLGGTNGFEGKARRLASKYTDRYRSLLETARYPESLHAFLDDDQAAANDAAVNDASADIGSDPASDDAEFPPGGPPLAPDGGGAMYAALAALDEDTDDEAVDEFALTRFANTINNAIDDRRRLGEMMLPGPLGAAVKGPPWWKGVLIRGAILLVNYLQASQGQREALKQQRREERDFPHSPTF